MQSNERYKSPAQAATVATVPSLHVTPPTADSDWQPNTNNRLVKTNPPKSPNSLQWRAAVTGSLVRVTPDRTRPPHTIRTMDRVYKMARPEYTQEYALAKANSYLPRP